MPFLTGSFLVARPVLQDPNFRQTVVLLLKHTAEGAFGLVVNRPSQRKGLPFPLFLGGPCPADGMLMLHGHADWAASALGPPDQPIAPAIYLGDAACLKRAGEAKDQTNLHYRVFSGYSGWGPGQLEGELAANAWTVVRATGQLLFETPVADLWELLAPPKIPQPSVN